MEYVLLSTPIDSLPTFHDLVTAYGPYLGLLIFIVILAMWLQYYWYSRLVKAKNEEILRLTKHEENLSERLLHIIDEKIGYKHPKVKP